MAQRLPIPGQDDNAWGGILNAYLGVEHNTDGTLKIRTDGTVKQTLASLTDVQGASGATNSQVLAYNSSSTKWVPSTVSSTTVGDATTSSKGIVQLAGDLAGTAASPTVPGLAGKEPTITSGSTSQYFRGDKSFQTLDKTAVGLGNVDNTSDANKPISTATQTALNAKASTSGLATVATSGSYTDLTSKPTIPGDATTSAKGIVQLAGDLAGTAASPTVAKVSGVSITGTPSANQVLTATSSSAAGWATPATAPVTSVNTRTGAITLTKTDVGLANVDNTSDAAKPVSTATQTALDAKLAAASNLSDVANAGTARTNLGLGSAATHPASDFAIGLAAEIVVQPSGDTTGVADVASLNAAFTASATAGGTVVRTRGKYYVNATVLITGLSWWDGYGTTLKQVNAANLDAVVASPAAMTTGTGGSMDLPLAIVGLSIDANRSGQTSGIGHGIFVASGAHLTNKGATTGAPLFMDCVVRETRSIGICNSEINIAGNDLTVPSGGYGGEQRFIRNRAFNCGAWGIRTQAGSSPIMFDGFAVDNIVAYTTFDGLRIDAAAGWQIDNNHIYGTGFSGLVAVGVYATRITENYIEGVGVLDSAANHFSTSSAFVQAAAWSSATTYGLNDVATSGSVIYRSKIDNNTNNTPSTSPTQWGASVGAGTIAGIFCPASGSGRTNIVAKNQISLGHNSWSLNSAFSYCGIWLQGPGTGTSKTTSWIIDNEISNELQPAGTNTTALKLSGTGAGPSGVNPYERDNAVRGSWNANRQADSTSSPIGAVGANASGGTGSAITVTGNNEAGNISVTAGTTSLAAGALASISYTAIRGVSPRIVVMPRNAASAALGPIYTTTNTSGFTVNTSVAPTASATYSFDYVTMVGA